MLTGGWLNLKRNTLDEYNSRGWLFLVPSLLASPPPDLCASPSHRSLFLSRALNSLPSKRAR